MSICLVYICQYSKNIIYMEHNKYSNDHSRRIHLEISPYISICLKQFPDVAASEDSVHPELIMDRAVST